MRKDNATGCWCNSDLMSETGTGALDSTQFYTLKLSLFHFNFNTVKCRPSATTYFFFQMGYQKFKICNVFCNFSCESKLSFDLVPKSCSNCRRCTLTASKSLLRMLQCISEIKQIKSHILHRAFSW